MLSPILPQIDHRPLLECTRSWLLPRGMQVIELPPLEAGQAEACRAAVAAANAMDAVIQVGVPATLKEIAGTWSAVARAAWVYGLPVSTPSTEHSPAL